MTAAGIVLAGGAGSRFGGAKLLAEVRGRPVLHHALLAVGSVADPIVLVLAPGAAVPPLPVEVATRVVVARDAVAQAGPLAGLVAGLAALPPGTDAALVAAGDMPAMVPSVLRLLLATLGSDPELGVACLGHDPPSPLPAAVRPPVAAAAAAALLARDRRSLRGLAAVVPAAVVPASSWRRLDPPAATLRDVDTPGDLDLA